MNDEEEEDVVGAGGEMEEPLDDDDDDEDELEDQVAETVQMSGVAAARNRRLKAQKDAGEEQRHTPGNAASQQHPYE